MKIVVSAEGELEQVQDAVDQLEEAVQQLQLTLEALDRRTIDLSELDFGGLDSMIGSADKKEMPKSWQQAKYTVGRWEMTYADVAWEELEPGPFELDDAWEKIEPLIEPASGGDTYKSSLKRSLTKDARFEKLDRDDGTWFRKREQGELELEEQDEEG